MTRQKAVSSEIRRINRNLIFHYLYEHPGTTKQELTSALKLSMPTITQNLTELSNKGLVVNTDQQESTGGRKAWAFSINAGALHAIGLDITAHHIGAVIVNLAGNIIRSCRVDAAFSSTPFYFKGLAALIEELIDDAAIQRDTIIGVGIAVPAIISGDGQTLSYASVLNFTHGRLCDFAEFIRYPCRFVNDANAGGFAEFWNSEELRNASEGKGVVYLSLNYSVGGTFLVNGRTYEGQNQRASEFGHVTLIPEGRGCYCGQKGCADAYLSANVLSELGAGQLSGFFAELGAGAPDPTKRWREYLYHLALMVNSLRMAYDCGVILGGYVGSHMEAYMDDLREIVASRNPFEKDCTYLRDCSYKHEATAVGAALMLISDLIQSV